MVWRVWGAGHFLVISDRSSGLGRNHLPVPAAGRICVKADRFFCLGIGENRPRRLLCARSFAADGEIMRSP